MKRLLLLALLVYHLQAATSLIVASKGGAATATSTTIYGGMFQGNGLSSNTATTESVVQFPVPLAGTFCGFEVYIITNGVTANSTATFRIGTGSYPPSTSDGTQIVTIGSGQTGIRTQAVANCDHVAAGNFVNIKFVTGGTGTNIALGWYSVKFTPDDATKTWTKMGSYAAATFSSSGGNLPQTIAGLPTSSTRAEADQQFKFLTGGQLSGLCFNISSNSFSNNGSIRSRVNTANGNLTATVTAATATQYCTTGTDTIAANDLVSVDFTPASGSAGSLVLEGFALDFVTTDNTTNWIIQNAGGGSTVSVSTTRYLTPLGALGQNSTQGQYAPDALIASTSISAMTVHVLANTLSNDTTIELWKNNASTGLIATISSGVTNSFVAATGGPVSLLATDLIELKMIAGTAGTSLALASVSIKASMPATPTSSFIHHKVSGGL